MVLTERALSLIKEERKKQDIKWGRQRHSDEMWMIILIEEVGELAQAIQKSKGWGKESDPDNKIEEVIHAAAVATAILEQFLEYQDIEDDVND